GCEIVYSGLYHSILRPLAHRRRLQNAVGQATIPHAHRHHRRLSQLHADRRGVGAGHEGNLLSARQPDHFFDGARARVTGDHHAPDAFRLEVPTHGVDTDYQSPAPPAQAEQPEERRHSFGRGSSGRGSSAGGSPGGDASGGEASGGEASGGEASGGDASGRDASGRDSSPSSSVSSERKPMSCSDASGVMPAIFWMSSPSMSRMSCRV